MSYGERNERGNGAGADWGGGVNGLGWRGLGESDDGFDDA